MPSTTTSPASTTKTRTKQATSTGPKKAAKQGPSDEWYTPRTLVAALAKLVDVTFIVDPAATAAATKAPVWFDQEADGLAQDWHATAQQHRGDAANPAAWLNPPYSNARPWVAKAAATARAGTTVVALLRASSETAYWRTHIWPHAADIYFITGRLAFETADGTTAGNANHANAIIVWRPHHQGPPRVHVIDTNGRLAFQTTGAERGRPSTSPVTQPPHEEPTAATPACSPARPQRPESPLETPHRHEVREAPTRQHRQQRRVRHPRVVSDGADRPIPHRSTSAQHQVAERLDLARSVSTQLAVRPPARRDVVARVPVEPSAAWHTANLGAGTRPAAQPRPQLGHRAPARPHSRPLVALASTASVGHTRRTEHTFDSTMSFAGSKVGPVNTASASSDSDGTTAADATPPPTSTGGSGTGGGPDQPTGGGSDGDRSDRDALLDYIAKYTPKMDAKLWTPKVASLVRTLVADRDPHDTNAAAKLLTVGSRFVVWAHHTRSLPLDVATIFTEDNIEAWLATQTSLGAGWKKAAASELRRLNPDYTVPPPRPQGLRREVTIAEFIDQYRPRTVSRSTWKVVRHLAIDAVRRAEPATTAAATRDLSTAAGYLAWCSRQDGMPLTAARIWADAAIERYVAQQIAADADRSSAAAGTTRSVLRRVGAAVPGNAVTRPPRAYPKTDRQPPYTPAQVARLRQAAQAEATPRRRHTFAALLCLTVGAGLGEHDVAWPCGTDVTREADGAVTVTFSGPRGRTAIVDDAWADQLLELADKAGDEPLIGGEKPGAANVTNSLIATLTLDPALKPVTATRLRDTWLAQRTAAGTHLAAILQQAGLNSFSALDRFVVHLEPPHPDEHRAQLRTSRSPATHTLAAAHADKLAAARDNERGAA